MTVVRRGKAGLSLAVAAVISVGAPIPAWADYIGTELGGAADFGVLDTSTNGNISMANAASAGFVIGNVGVSGTSPGNFSDSGVNITGSLDLGGSQKVTLSGATISGGINLSQGSVLSADASLAALASTTFAGLTATQTISGGAVTGTRTITAANQGGLNVIDLSAINLGNGDTLTLKGSAGTEFILNDSGGLTLNSANIVLTGGLTKNDVVYNVTGGSVATSGGLNNESTLKGIILAENTSVSISPGAVTGEIIGGENINIASGGSVSGAPGPTMGAGLPGFVLLGGLAFAWRLRRRLDGAPPTSPVAV